MNLNAARVFVTDIEEAKIFYATKLGLPIKVDGSKFGYCVFRSGSTDPVVESVAEEAPREDQALVGRFTGLSFSVASVEETYRELEAKGVPFTGLPEKQAWGGTLATLRDPAGNELQLAQHPTAA